MALKTLFQVYFQNFAFSGGGGGGGGLVSATYWLSRVIDSKKSLNINAKEATATWGKLG